MSGGAGWGEWGCGLGSVGVRVGVSGGARWDEWGCGLGSVGVRVMVEWGASEKNKQASETKQACACTRLEVALDDGHRRGPVRGQVFRAEELHALHLVEHGRVRRVHRVAAIPMRSAQQVESESKSLGAAD